MGEPSFQEGSPYIPSEKFFHKISHNKKQKFSTACGKVLWKTHIHTEKTPFIRLFGRLFAFFSLFLQVFLVEKKRCLWKSGGKEKPLDKQINFCYNKSVTSAKIYRLIK